MFILSTAPLAYANETTIADSNVSCDGCHAMAHNVTFIDCTTCHGGDGTPGNNLNQSNMVDIYEYIKNKLKISNWFKFENKNKEL